MLLSPLRLQAARHPAANLVLVEGELEPATPGDKVLVAPYHIHRNDEEIFYVLSGRLGFEVEDDEFIASAGDAVMVPAGAIHSWWNVDPKPARYLIAMSTMLDDLIIAIHERSYSAEEMAEVFERHDSIYIGWTR